MNNLGTKKLETERLILRKFKLKDTDQMYENWATDEEALKYIPWTPHENINRTTIAVNTYISEYDNENYFWAIELKENKKVIGSIGFHNFNERVNSIELGYIIGSKFWNKGYITEAIEIVLEYMFNEVGATRISAFVAPENPSSTRVLEKNGFIYEGRMRKAGIGNVGVVDLNIYGILKEEYNK